MKLLRWGLAGVLGVALVLAALVNRGNAPSRSSSLRTIGFGAPIAGDRTTLVEARARVNYPVPTLPTVVLADPCFPGESITTTLRDVWASPVDVATAERQIGLTYSKGLWVSVTPKTWFVPQIGDASEMPLLTEVFDAEDFPSGLAMGVVRGRRAWLNEFDSGALCGSGGQSSSARGPGAAPQSGVGGGGVEGPPPTLGLGPPGTEVLANDEQFTGHLLWTENGVVIHVSGPFSVAVLQSLASQITWV